MQAAVKGQEVVAHVEEGPCSRRCPLSRMWDGLIKHMAFADLKPLIFGT